MNIEDYREYCLSLSTDIEEKLPFQKFKNGEGVLVFYVMGHISSFFDCNDFSVISLKCEPERIEDLKAEYECIGNPCSDSVTRSSTIHRAIPATRHGAWEHSLTRWQEN